MESSDSVVSSTPASLNEIVIPSQASQASQASQPSAPLPQAPSEEKKTRIIVGLPGDRFSQAFVLSWTQTLSVLLSMNKYEILVSPGKSSFVSFARMQTLGVDVLRGKKQKPFNGDNYDIYVTIDSDIVFTPSQFIELVECTKLHAVVSGFYMMADNKNFAVVRDWNKDYFSKNGTFPFLQMKDMEKYLTEFQTQLKERKEAEEKKEEVKPIPNPEFLKVAYAGLGFFACRKEVLDDLQYPFFNRELQRLRGKDGLELVDMCGEDVAFCKNIEDAGYDIMLNTRLRVGHEKSIIL
jgi:hypothetical protein